VLKLKLLLLLSVFFVANSCKKNEEKSKKFQLLTKKSWVVVNHEENLNGGGFTSDFANSDPCSKDDKFTFFTNYTLELDPLIQCTNEQKQVGPWSFTENETKLVTGSEVNSILQLDDNTLVLSKTTIIGADTYIERITFGH
jgi:3',5'-cyclic AMP phosphodiesterase CpdA